MQETHPFSNKPARLLERVASDVREAEDRVRLVPHVGLPAASLVPSASAAEAGARLLKNACLELLRRREENLPLLCYIQSASKVRTDGPCKVSTWLGPAELDYLPSVSTVE